MFLIVQSLYNLTAENTSLAFEVCNNTVADCDNGLSTTTMGFVITEMPNGPDEQNPVIIIVIASVAGVLEIALILVGCMCWKHKRKQSDGNEEGIFLL